MDNRAALVVLITEGAAPQDIIHFFWRRGMERAKIDEFLYSNGIKLPRPLSTDDIPEDRRRELQNLSLT